MKGSNKIIAAFLVSAGLVSNLQAAQYVNSMSAKEKKAMMAVAVMAEQDSVVEPTENGSVPGTNKN